MVMRTVGSAELQRLGKALDAAHEMLQRCAKELLRLAERTARLEAAGHIQEARTIGVRAVVRMTAEQANMSARLSSAAEAFLGERRGPDEGLADYLLRLQTAVGSIQALAETHRRNGIVYTPGPPVPILRAGGAPYEPPAALQ